MAKRPTPAWHAALTDADREEAHALVREYMVRREVNPVAEELRAMTMPDVSWEERAAAAGRLVHHLRARLRRLSPEQAEQLGESAKRAGLTKTDYFEAFTSPEAMLLLLEDLPRALSVKEIEPTLARRFRRQVRALLGERVRHAHVTSIPASALNPLDALIAAEPEKLRRRRARVTLTPTERRVDAHPTWTTARLAEALGMTPEAVKMARSRLRQKRRLS